MRSKHAAIAAAFVILFLASVSNVVAQRPFINLGSPYPWAQNIWDLTPAHRPGTQDTIYGGVSRGLLPPGSEGRMFLYYPPDYGNFQDIGEIDGEEVIYSLTTSHQGLIYGGTGIGAHFFSYEHGSLDMEDLGIPVSGETYVCDLTQAFMPDNDRVYGGTAYNAHFFWYDPDQPGFTDFGVPVPGETGIWALTSGTSVAGFIVGGTGPNGYLFQVEAMADTYPPPFVYGSLGSPIGGLTSGLAAAPTAGKIYGGTLAGYFFEYEPYERVINLLRRIDDELPGVVTALTTGIDSMIYFGATMGDTAHSPGPGEGPICRVYQYDPTEPWNPGPYPWSNPRWWWLPEEIFWGANRIRSLCTDTLTGWIYGGTGCQDTSQPHIACLFRFDPELVDGGSQAAGAAPAGSPGVLFESHPNPFAGMTEIRYQLQEAVHINLGLYDLSGRLVTVLVHGRQSAGEHCVRWYGTDVLGNEVPPGIYLCRLNADGAARTRKLILLG